MLKKTKLLLGFTAVLTALLIVVSCFIQPERITDASWIDNRDRNALSVMNEPENSIDVLVLGDSESFTAISPYRLWQKQKITAYVCGQSGQQISEAYYLMKRAFQKQHPRLVILGDERAVYTCQISGRDTYGGDRGGKVLHAGIFLSQPVERFSSSHRNPQRSDRMRFPGRDLRSERRAGRVKRRTVWQRKNRGSCFPL